MCGKKPGVQENGGVYLHACAFKLVADCMRKDRQKVEENIQRMLPFSNTGTPIRDGEPYVFCNCYFAIENSYRFGTCGQSWGTGTAGWFYAALLNHVYGLRPEPDGLRVDPCLPPSWKTCGVTRVFRGAVYHVAYEQKGSEGRTEQIKVNGDRFKGEHLPCTPGREYRVQVTLV